MKDLRLIKKFYGEKMMHLCRELFPSILEHEGLLFSLIDSHFDRSRNLYDDILIGQNVNHFKNFINNLIQEDYANKTTDKSVKELLNIAGYNFYECNTDEEIQEFKKYYSNEKNEELCTFREQRLLKDYVFFAVKKNVDEIKREDFSEPKRQDLYGTSVISIQFGKADNRLSIKNRYNHTVLNPDATFSNNLENIMPGLTDAFEKEYNLKIISNKHNFELDNYVLASDGKFYKTNFEHNNIYYGPNNTIIDNGKVIEKYRDKAKYIVMDYFIVDIPNKRIKLYDDRINDPFASIYDKFEKIEIESYDQDKTLHITYKDKIVEIKINKYNQITSLKDNQITEIGNNFLKLNGKLAELELNNVKKIGDAFLLNNSLLKDINLPNITEIGSYFLESNEITEKFYAPNLLKVGDSFMNCNLNLKEINVDSIITVGNYFLCKNTDLVKFCATYLEKVGTHFLSSNSNLEIIDLPSLKYAGSFCLMDIQKIKNICFESLIMVDVGFMEYSKNLQSINLPKAEIINNSFLRYNQSLLAINIPNVTEIGDYFLAENKNIDVIHLPKVKIIHNEFMRFNGSLSILIAPNLVEIGDDFLMHNENIEYLYLDSLKKSGDNLLHHNNHLKKYYAPNHEKIRFGSFMYTKNINEITVPNNCDIYWQCFNLNDEQREQLIDSIKENGHWEKGYCKKKIVA